jgi:hypothetical protein
MSWLPPLPVPEEYTVEEINSIIGAIQIAINNTTDYNYKDQLYSAKTMYVLRKEELDPTKPEAPYVAPNLPRPPNPDDTYQTAVEMVELLNELIKGVDEYSVDSDQYVNRRHLWSEHRDATKPTQELWYPEMPIPDDKSLSNINATLATLDNLLSSSITSDYEIKLRLAQTAYLERKTELEQPTSPEPADEIDLSIFTYPHYYSETGSKTIDFEITRDTPPGIKKMYFEFLFIYKPDASLEPQATDIYGNTVGCYIVRPGDYFGNELKGYYSPEYVQQIRETIPEPYITLSGLGSNVKHLVSRSNEYIDNTVAFIVDFCKYECGFKGINVNVERLGELSSADTAQKYLTFLQKLTDALHEEDLKIIFTTQTECFLQDTGGEALEPALYRPSWLHFYNDMIYDIDFDYINYMCIDNFWNVGDKAGGHYDYKSLKLFLDTAKQEDPKFQERTIIQFSNYAVWGYTEGQFGAPTTTGYQLTEKERLVYTNSPDTYGLRFQYQIFVKHQIEALIAGDERGADIYGWWKDGSDDIRWDAENYAGINMINGWRGEDDSLYLKLGTGNINRRTKPQEAWRETFLMWSDQYTLDQKMNWVYQNYGLKKFSVWHAHRDTVWFSEETVNTITGSGFPTYTVDGNGQIPTRPNQPPEPTQELWYPEMPIPDDKSLSNINATLATIDNLLSSSITSDYETILRTAQQAYLARKTELEQPEPEEPEPEEPEPEEPEPEQPEPEQPEPTPNPLGLIPALVIGFLITRYLFD